MVELDVSMAPGCYGISLLHREGSNECRTCPFAPQCAPIARAQLVALRAELGIKPASVKVSKAGPSVSPTPSSSALSTRMPVKVQELVDSIERAGIKVCEALSRGINPFHGKFPFMYVACHMLLKAKHEGIARERMSKAFENTLHIGKGTADAYAAQAVRALKEIGAINESNGLARLRA